MYDPSGTGERSVFSSVVSNGIVVMLCAFEMLIGGRMKEMQRDAAKIRMGMQENFLFLFL